MLYTLLLVGFLSDRPVTAAWPDMDLIQCTEGLVNKVELAIKTSELDIQFIGCEVQYDETKEGDSTGAVGL